MKLSNETLTILKNFAGHSEGLFVPEGSRIRIKNSKSNMLAEAHVAENFPTFCVAELNKFLGVLTVDKDVDVEFDGPNIILSMLKGRSKITYRCAAQSLVSIPKDSDMTVTDDETVATLTLTKDTLRYVEKGLALLGLRHVAFEYDGSKLFIRLFDPQNDSADQQTFDLEDGTWSVTTDEPFQRIHLAELLTIADGDYVVKLGNGRTEFAHTSLNLRYWLAYEI